MHRILLAQGVIFLKKLNISALVFGVVAAALAVCAQVFYSVHPPQAYGICLVCHAKDFMNAIFSQFSWYDGSVSMVGKKGLMLTTVFVIAGAFIAAVVSREFRLRVVENKFTAFIGGFVVMVCGLIVAGCPMRVLLRFAYGDLMGLYLILTVILGIFVGTRILKRRARKT